MAILTATGLEYLRTAALCQDAAVLTAVLSMWRILSQTLNRIPTREICPVAARNVLVAGLTNAAAVFFVYI